MALNCISKHFKGRLSNFTCISMLVWWYELCYNVTMSTETKWWYARSIAVSILPVNSFVCLTCTGHSWDGWAEWGIEIRFSWDQQPRFASCQRRTWESQLGRLQRTSTNSDFVRTACRCMIARINVCMYSVDLFMDSRFMRHSTRCKVLVWLHTG